MRYPTEMNIAGVTVPITVHDTPLHTVYKCPVCKDADDGTPLIKYVKHGADKGACPACDNTALQPTGFDVYGTFDVTRLAIDISALSEQMGGFNLVHETIEAINTFCDLNLEHTQISTLGNMLYQAFASGNVDFTPSLAPSTVTVQ